MRKPISGGLALVLGLASSAAAPEKAAPEQAAPEKAAVSPWADWVGDYSGALTWRGCSAPGAAAAGVVLDAVDAVMSIDLGKLGGGLRAMSLLEEEGGWSARQGDVQVRIARPKTAGGAGAIDLLVELDSGCTVSGRLQRASSGVPACDRLVSWSRIEARCGKLSQRGKKPLEDAALVAKTAWRAADAEKCVARADRVE